MSLQRCHNACEVHSESAVHNMFDSISYLFKHVPMPADAVYPYNPMCMHRPLHLLMYQALMLLGSYQKYCLDPESNPLHMVLQQLDVLCKEHQQSLAACKRLMVADRDKHQPQSKSAFAVCGTGLAWQMRQDNLASLYMCPQ